MAGMEFAQLINEGDILSTYSREKTAGFVGLGMMGLPMAMNILRAGHPLVVFDIHPEPVAQLVRLGAQPATSAADVAARARYLVSMVDTTAQATDVIMGAAGFLSSGREGDVVISMSTIDPMALRDMHARLAARGMDLIDAPVSGLEKGAREGTLKAFAGGSAEALDKARPVLNAMCSEIIHFGAIGNGTTMKLVNNMLFQVGRVLVAEALALDTSAGLDPRQMVDVIGKATGNSAAFQYCAPRILDRDFQGIRMDITFKDIELQCALAKSLQMPLFMANMAQQVYQMARARGLGGEDGAAIVKVYEQFTGVAVTAG